MYIFEIDIYHKNKFQRTCSKQNKYLGVLRKTNRKGGGLIINLCRKVTRGDGGQKKSCKCVTAYMSDPITVSP